LQKSTIIIQTKKVTPPGSPSFWPSKTRYLFKCFKISIFFSFKSFGI
jgi:hypothetical protein